MTTTIADVRGYGLSSPYGSRNALGHPLRLKSLGLVEVVTSSGVVGLGETYAGVYAPELIAPTIEFLKPFLVGLPVEAIGAVQRRLEQLPFIGRNGFISSVASAVDIALWDIAGKLAGVPVWQLFGAPGRNAVRLYASSGSSVFTPQEIADDVRLVRELGYGAYKMRVGFQDWSADLERVETARRHLGDADLMIDAIMGSLDPPWDAETAISRSADLAQFGPAWLEEPVHPSNLAGLKAVRDRSTIPIASGEALTGKFEFQQYLAADALDYLQPDATHSGGLSATAEIIRQARGKNVKVALHVWGGAPAIAANAHLALASPDVEILEYPMMHLDITQEMFVTPLDIRGGFMTAPQEPGLGVQLTDDVKRRYRLVPGSGYRI